MPRPLINGVMGAISSKEDTLEVYGSLLNETEKILVRDSFKTICTSQQEIDRFTASHLQVRAKSYNTVIIFTRFTVIHLG